MGTQKILFFRDILKEYLEECNRRGYEKRLERVGVNKILNNLESINVNSHLESMLKTGILQFGNGDGVRFRGKNLCHVDTDIIHALGNRRLILERVPHISLQYFNEIIECESTVDEKLKLLKTLLQAMNWGLVWIMNSKQKIIVEIINPPPNLKSRDNWDFMLLTVLGYLWLLDVNFKLVGVRKNHKKLTVTYLK